MQRFTQIGKLAAKVAFHMMSHDYAISAKALVKRYGEREVVSGFSMQVARGECYGLLGPNGAGKTTTLRMLLGLTHADAGEITVLGHAIPAEARIARTRIGVVPQADNLDPDFTVQENIVVYGRYFGMSDAQVRSRIPELLDFAQLADRAKDPIQSLSGGMKRRLVLARALVNDPELIFLDEPTTGLDPQARHALWGRLRALLKQGKTILLTTHFMDEAERLCERLAIIDNGKEIAAGAPRALIEQHVEPEVVEVSGDDVNVVIEQHHAVAGRVEIHGETAYCYIQDAEPLTHALKGANGIRVLNRPANLEDVFLKVTGRELRD